jgi:hypothetical protein
VSKEKLDLAVASHPSLYDPIEHLPPIPLERGTMDNQKVLLPSVVEDFSTIVEAYNVCGMVVNWPVQKEGWCGAPCGHVLHTLDQISRQSESVVNDRRPVCLWNEDHRELPEDSWGRVAMYSRETDKTVHHASKEQYGAKNLVVSNVWKGFVQTHWPDFPVDEDKEWDEGKHRMVLQVC